MGRHRSLLGAMLLSLMSLASCSSGEPEQIRIERGDVGAEVVEEQSAASADQLGGDSPEGQQAIEEAVALIEAETSFNFTQGARLSGVVPQLNAEVAPDGPIVTGQVNGDNIYFRSDWEKFYIAIFESLGRNLDDPAIAPLVESVGGAALEVWITPDRIVVDATAAVPLIEAFELTTSAEAIDVYAAGPIGFDADAGVINPGAMTNSISDGVPLQDPTEMLRLLTVAEAVRHDNRYIDDPFNTWWIGEVPIGEYYEILGADFESELGDLAGAPSQDFAEQFQDLMRDFSVDVSFGVHDETSKLRYLETSFDMSDVLTQLTGGFPMNLRSVVWQEFTIDTPVAPMPPVPEAVDVTDRIDEFLLEN